MSMAGNAVRKAVDAFRKGKFVIIVDDEIDTAGTLAETVGALEREGVTELATQPKTKLARALIHHIAARYRAKNDTKVRRLRRP